MAMAWSSKVYQDGSSFLVNTVKSICVCSTRPTTIPMALGTSSTGTGLAKTTTLASSDFTYAASTQTPSGWKLTLAAFSSMQVFDAGTADHIALCGTVAGAQGVLYTVTCTTRALTTSDKVSVPSFDILDIAGPAT